MAHVLARQGISTTLLVRKDSIADDINERHRHPTYDHFKNGRALPSFAHQPAMTADCYCRYLSDLELPPNVVATADPKLALSDAT